MKTWTPDDYGLQLAGKPEQAIAERVFDLVWRFDFTAPGFCHLDARPGIDAHTLRAWMVELKEQLSEVAQRRVGYRFAYRSMARFDQQETTKFHLDGGPDRSMLMLGYEPSQVRSRLFLADSTQAAFDLGITPQQFLHDYNPIYRRGEEYLARYITELPPAEEGHSRILLVNNSTLSLNADRKNPLGVMHKAEIVNPTAPERRLVNSTMLVVGETDEVGQDQQGEFVSTDKISPKVY